MDFHYANAEEIELFSNFMAHTHTSYFQAML